MELTNLSYLDLFAQVAVFLLLLIDSAVFRRRGIKQHGMLMTSVFVINVALTLFVMLPVFWSEGTVILEDITGIDSLLILSHHAIGLIAELLGAFLVVKWWIKALDISSCKGKGLMRATLGTWILSLLLGFAIFVLHFIE